MAPFSLAQEFHSLPPILHMTAPSPIPGYSKAPRGLFVLPQVARVFTGTAISPSPPLRQCPSRSTIHAGRNLPDKGLRYLRTVRVTAAVHWGFRNELAPIALTFQHRAGVRPYTSTYVLAEPCVFDKQSLLPGLCHLLMVAQKKVFFIPKLQKHFAEFLQHHSLKRLGIFYLPTCVGLRYDLYAMAISRNHFTAFSIQ